MASGLQSANHQNKVAQWAEQISACRSSGLSVRAWCSDHNINTQTYYRWQKRLFAMAAAQHDPQFAEIDSLRLRIRQLEKHIIDAGMSPPPEEL